jgi:catechol 2,3-dioxygenase-like lactoylglutathione lyase family enzyme
LYNHNMFKAKAAFSGFSVKDLKKAKEFYSEVLGLKVGEDDWGLTLHLPDSEAKVYVYQKDDHEPAVFTVFNLVVDDIDKAVDALVEKGVKFEKYEGFNQDEKGVARGKEANMGPDIAWLKDPDGNIFSVLQD